MSFSLKLGNPYYHNKHTVSITDLKPMAKKTSPASAFSPQPPTYDYSKFKVPSSMLVDSNTPVLSESDKGTSKPATSTSDSATSASSAN